MNKIVEFLTEGMLLMTDGYVAPRAYTRPSVTGFHQDQSNLRGDVRKVGVDMTRAISKHGKQPYKSSSHK